MSGGGSAELQRVQVSEAQQHVVLFCLELQVHCAYPYDREVACDCLLCESSVVRICEECPAEVEPAQTRLGQLNCSVPLVRPAMTMHH